MFDGNHVTVKKNNLESVIKDNQNLKSPFYYIVTQFLKSLFSQVG